MGVPDPTRGRIAVPLSVIAGRVNPLCTLGDARSVVVTDVVFDHREVTPGALFCCLGGEHADGHDFAGAARRAGAVAFICEHSLADAAGATQLVVAPGTAREAMALAACAFYGDPARTMKVVGVTGTNGKTTTTYLLRSILERHGWRTGVLGTLDGVRTTPEAPHLQRALARQRDVGTSAIALEVSSHALVQHRVAGMRFNVAVFTNLTQDHLDYHGTMEAYFAAKASLFTPELAAAGVVNTDDPYGQRLFERAAIPMERYALADARDLDVGLGHASFRLDGAAVRLRMGGEFNVRNALAAAAAARALGATSVEIAEGLSAAPAVTGRFEPIEAGGVVALVDYAHTPHGLEEVLHAARGALAANELNVTTSRDPAKAGRIIVVFGAGGERDRGKRPAMGEVASRLADLVVVTSDNPRRENAAVIAREILAGASGVAATTVELDRRRAIARALATARPGDVVVVAGKGHETTQQFADRSVRFDDREVVREEFARRGLLTVPTARPIA